MGQVTIVLKDVGEVVETTVEFDPPLNDNDVVPASFQCAIAMLQAARDQQEKDHD